MSEDKTRENARKGFNRRDFLTASVATGTLLGLPSIVGAREGPREKFRSKVDAALEKRDKTNDYESWITYLEKNGCKVASDGVYYRFGETEAVATESDDGVSTQSFSEYDLATKISLVYDCEQSVYYGETAFSYDFSSGTGDNPIDHSAVAWTKDTWFLDSTDLSETTRTSAFVYADDSVGFQGEGGAYEVYDSSVWYNGSESKWYYGGVYMRPADDDRSADERYIQGAYNHNWNEIDVSVSISPPTGLAITPSVEEYSWRTSSEKDGNQLLRLYESEAEYTCGIEP